MFEFNCEFCFKDTPVCKARDKETSFGCTRTEGHSGDHVACGFSEHAVYRWPNTDSERKD